jgi:hypothetical protein
MNLDWFSAYVPCWLVKAAALVTILVMLALAERDRRRTRRLKQKVAALEERCENARKRMTPEARRLFDSIQEGRKGFGKPVNVNKLVQKERDQ